MAFEKKTFELQVGDKKLTLQTSSLAGQANAAVLGKYGETVVLASVVMTKHASSANYLPLKVDYEERFYAAGKIIGSRFIRREGRPSEDAILSGRLVDRTIRPLFDQRLRRDIQVVITVLSFDEENDPDFVGLIAASAALAISDVPWAGPVGGVRVGKRTGQLIVNPSHGPKEEELEFEAFVAGPEGHVNMIEFGGKEIGEDEALQAFEAAQQVINALVKFQKDIVREIGKEKAVIELHDVDAALKSAIKAFLGTRLAEAFYAPTKQEQVDRLASLRKEAVEKLKEQHGEDVSGAVEAVFEEELDRMLHEDVLESGKRPDGRALDAVRALGAEVRLFERTHGSAVFSRGTTQALAVTTLAPPGAEQIIESMETSGRRRFMLHYNFPPYSVGEVGPFRGPGRREIGHGALAEKAIRPLLPSKEDFPYTIRVVSEVLSSNGSSSMATVCASVLSLMDAGVPITKPAAGIAMGYIGGEDGGLYKILTDIQGPEDHYGDMDFKVAGTADGITAMQMDTKVHGLTLRVLRDGLAQAKKARLEILDFMKTILASPRSNISRHAPRIVRIKISPEKIGAVIGPGGKIINGLIRTYELMGIDIEEDGNVFVSGTDAEQVGKALDDIKALTREFKVGEFVEGTIVKILEFGAIVDLGGGQDGMIHVSELKEGYTKSVEEVVKVGDFVRAKIIRAEDGRIGLSLKQRAS